jgi:Na+/H+ antiporter NhaD/arsenite permease-like protein
LKKNSALWKILGLLGFLLVVGLWLRSLGLSPAQVQASVVFLSIIGGTLMYWERRLFFAFTGISVLLTLKLLNVPHLVEHAGLDIILFLVGMMTVVGFLEERRFFEHVMDEMVNRVGPDAPRLVIALMIASFISAALVDEVTSILFMLTTLLHITNKHKIDPVPFMLILVFATNIGSAATVVGNPIGVLIALRAGFSFADFLRWATPVALLALLAIIPICLLMFQKPIQELDEKLKKDARKKGDELVEVTPIPRRQLQVSWALFGTTIGLLVLHQQIEAALGLDKNTLLLGVALAAAAASLWLSGDKARDLIEKRVDWWTLSFFLVLFASVGTLQMTGVSKALADWVVGISGNNVPFILVLITSLTSLLTALLDNVLAVATLVPVMKELDAVGIFTTPIWWGMLFAGTFFGNATMIGSTANIVAIGFLERRKLGKVHFWLWAKPGIVVSLIAIVIGFLGIYFQIPLMPR